jgi:uncharacterized protein (DUF1778 family)
MSKAYIFGASAAPTSRIDRYGILPYIESAMKQEPLPTARLEARLPHDVMARLRRAAEIQGRTLTDFVVAAADEAACRAIQDTEIIRLSIEGQRQIAAAILNPPAPTAALKRAAKRYRELFGVA